MTAQPPFSRDAWFAAARPHTLSAAMVPVLVGSALSFSLGSFSWSVFGLTLLGAVLVQIGANFTDEFADHGATGSAHKYLAPHKVIARGLLTPRQVKRGALVVFGLATLIGMILVWQSGWELLLLCLASLGVAYFYSAGPRPLGDIALGEPLVFVMMGPVMVLGTVFVQTHTWEPLALWASLPVAALVTAILVANNLRDAEEDARNGRRTLVTVLGTRVGRGGYYVLLLTAFAFVPLANWWGQAGAWVWLCWLTLPLAWRVIPLIRAENQRDTLHRALKSTSALHALFGLLLALGFLLGGS
ncbi:MAG: 1,4-dihydroxy-2-naphthoate octaprenyltransferase [Deltaproteobacteria bacterium]|nr:1,4-dihydroxy-2-naphthoate octaprenyltransferase [Deltaproteobacteria bacterium]